MESTWLRRSEEYHAELKVQLHRCHTDLRATEEQLKNVVRQIQEKVSTNAELEDDLQNCTGQLGEHKDKLAKCTAVLTDTARKLQRLENTHRAALRTVEELTLKSNQQGERAAGLWQELQAAAAQRADADVAYGRERSERERLHAAAAARVQELETELQTRAAELQGLREQADTHRRARAAWEEQLSERNTACAEIDSKYKELTELHSALKSNLGSTQENLWVTQQALQVAQRDAAAQQIKADGVGAEIDRWRDALDERDGALQACNQRIAQLTHELRETEQKFAEADAEAGRLRLAQDAVDRRLRDCDNRAARAEAELQRWKDAVDEERVKAEGRVRAVGLTHQREVENMRDAANQLIAELTDERDRLQNDNQVLGRQLEDCLRDGGALRSDVDAERTLLGAARAESDELRRRLAALDADAFADHAALLVLQAELQTARDAAQQTSDDNGALRARLVRLDGQLADLQAAKGAVDAQLDACEAERRTLEGALRTQRDAVRQASDTNDALRAGLAGLDTELADLRTAKNAVDAQLAACATERQTAESELQAARGASQQASDANDALRVSITGLRAELVDLQAVKDAVDAQLVVCAAERQKLEAELTAERSAVRQASDANDTLSQTVRGLNAELADLRAAKGAVDAQLVVCAAERQKLEAELKAERSASRNTSTANKSLRAGLAGLKAHAADLRAAKGKVDAQLADLQTAKGAVDAQLLACTTERQSLEAELQAARNGSHQASDDNDALRVRLAGLDAELADLRAAKAAIDTRLLDLQTEKGAVDTQMAACAAERQNLEAALNQERDALQQVSAANDALRAEMADLRAAKAGIDTQLADLQTEKGAVDTQMAACAAERQNLEAALLIERDALQQVSDANDALRAELAGVRAAKDALDARLVACVAERQTLEDTLLTQRIAVRQASDANDALNATLTGLDAELSGLRTAKDAVDTRLAACEAERLALVDENANLRGIGNDARHGHRECQDRLNRLTDEATLLREELKLEKETRTRLHSDLMEEQEESTRQIASLGSQYSTQVDTLHREFQQERERLEGELRAASLERDDARRTIDRLRRETAEIQGRLTETDARRQADQDALRRCRDDGVQREAAWQSEWIRHRSEQNACAQALLNCVEARERTALEVQAADDAYDLVRTAPQPKRARTGATVDLDTFWSGMFLEPSARVFSAVDEGGL